MRTRVSFPIKLLTVFALAISLAWPRMAAAEREIIVVVDGALDVAEHLRKIGFNQIDKHPERLQAVPRTRILRIHKTVEDVWRENVSLRKSVFYRLGLSAILQVNEDITVQRNRLLNLSLENLSTAGEAWLSALMVRYRVTGPADRPTKKMLAQLIHRVDALPPSLVMAQGAIESGWAQSRFATKGQAMFGQWTTSKNSIKALNSEARLATFENPRLSLIAYMLNLNTHPAYSDLRKARAELRHVNQPLDGYTLAAHLGKYAETGGKYVKLIRSMIRGDGLGRGDSAKLASGPRILYVHKDHQ